MRQQTSNLLKKQNLQNLKCENKNLVKLSLNTLQLCYCKKWEGRRKVRKRERKKKKTTVPILKKAPEGMLSFSTSGIIRGKKKKKRRARKTEKKTKSCVVSLAQKFLIAGGRVSACDCVMWWRLSPAASGVTRVAIYLCVRVIAGRNSSDNSFSFQRPRLCINCAAVPECDGDGIKPHFYSRSWEQCWHDGERRWRTARNQSLLPISIVSSRDSGGFSCFLIWAAPHMRCVCWASAIIEAHCAFSRQPLAAHKNTHRERKSEWERERERDKKNI